MLTAREPFTGFYADHIGEFPIEAVTQTSTLLIKTHGLMPPATEVLPNALVIFSYRDPRDVVASLMQFLHIGFEDALSRVTENINSLRYAEGLASKSTIFKYEEGSVGSVSTIGKIADFLNVRIGGEETGFIARKLERSNVRRKIARLQQSGVIGSVQEPTTFDPDSLWHPGHVADGKVGKYANMLTDDEISKVLHCNSIFMEDRYS